MKIKSIEPTPSPNTMKINLTEELLAGKSNNYKKDQADQAPQLIKRFIYDRGSERGISCCGLLSR